MLHLHLVILALQIVTHAVSGQVASPIKVSIEPSTVLLGEPVRMTIHGLQPLQVVQVTAERVVRKDERFSSEMSFTADAKGFIDLTNSPNPQSEAPHRLLWSMKQVLNAKVDSKRTSEWEPLKTTIHVSHHGKIIASGTLVQQLIGEQVVRESVRVDGLAGTCFRPKQPGKYPAILVVGGSGGGLSENREALLASQGYVVLSLAYFNYENLPKVLVEIPFEYFEKSLLWLQRQPDVDPNRIAAIGTSRGGELALLLGATYPSIKAVVAYVPSHVVWGGMPFRSSWSYQGKPVPFMSRLPDQRIAKELMKADPSSHTPAFLLQLANADDVRQASIAVEKIKGPVLLFSGSDDKLWPSSFMCDRVMDRLKEHQHPYADEHFTYAGCGHNFPLPLLPPPPNRRKHRLTQQEIAYGGTTEATAYAAWDSWNQLKRFLKEHLGAK